MMNRVRAALESPFVMFLLLVLIGAAIWAGITAPQDWRVECAANACF